MKPDAVLSVGQAGEELVLQMERIAINVDDARIPDNIINNQLMKKFKQKVKRLIFQHCRLNEL